MGGRSGGCVQVGGRSGAESRSRSRRGAARSYSSALSRAGMQRMQSGRDRSPVACSRRSRRHRQRSCALRAEALMALIFACPAAAPAEVGAAGVAPSDGPWPSRSNAHGRAMSLPPTASLCCVCQTRVTSRAQRSRHRAFLASYLLCGPRSLTAGGGRARAHPATHDRVEQTTSGRAVQG